MKNSKRQINNKNLIIAYTLMLAHCLLNRIPNKVKENKSVNE